MGAALRCGLQWAGPAPFAVYAAEGVHVLPVASVRRGPPQAHGADFKVVVEGHQQRPAMQHVLGEQRRRDVQLVRRGVPARVCGKGKGGGGEPE